MWRTNMNFQLFFIGICINIASSQVTVPIKNYCTSTANDNPNCREIKCGAVSTQKISKEAAENVTRTFNAIRQKVAQGKVKDVPKAANMNALSYDEDLANLAAGEGKCPQYPFEAPSNISNYSMFPNDEILCPGRFSFNIYTTASEEGEAGTCSIPPGVLTGFLNMFGEEADLQKSYKEFNKNQSTYIQVMWAKSQKIGCAYTCTPQDEQAFSNYTLRCLLSPCGNIPGEIPYEEGEPCSKCDSTCSEEFPGLCK